MNPFVLTSLVLNFLSMCNGHQPEIESSQDQVPTRRARQFIVSPTLSELPAIQSITFTCVAYGRGGMYTVTIGCRGSDNSWSCLFHYICSQICLRAPLLTFAVHIIFLLLFLLMATHLFSFAVHINHNYHGYNSEAL